MSSGEIAALVTAVGVSIAGILTAIAALVNARNNAARVEILQTQVKKLETENATLRDHNDIQDAALLDREKLINRLQYKIDQWHVWGEKMGRAMNELQLIVGAYEVQKRGANTAPLPPLPDQPPSGR